MRDIENYKGLYSITEDGEVWSHARKYKSPSGGWIETGGRNLAQGKYGSGYYFVTLCKKGVRKQFMTHRLVAKAFIPNPKNAPEVNHKNGNKLDNKVSNLEWCTSKENKKHSWDLGLSKHKGEAQWNSRLTVKDIKDIRLRVKEGELQKDLAVEYKISRSATSKIVHGLNWAHIR